MAGRGPAPKPADQRARTNLPERGEWQSFPPLAKAVLPPLPRDRKWSERSKRMWAGWRADWATQAFGPAEVAMALEAIGYFDSAVVISLQPAVHAEFRQWVDRLGLNLKGKRDLRLRQAVPVARVGGPVPGSQLGELRLVDEVASTA